MENFWLDITYLFSSSHVIPWISSYRDKNFLSSESEIYPERSLISGERKRWSITPAHSSSKEPSKLKKMLELVC